VASLETAQLSNERLFYSRVDSGRVAISGVADYPDDEYTDPNDYTQELNGNGVKIGTSIVLKVMTGDQVMVRVSCHHARASTIDPPVNPFNDLVGAITNSIGGIPGSHYTSGQLESSGVLSSGITSFLNSHSSYDDKLPKAFLNWVLFDEQFKYVSGSSGFVQPGKDDNIIVLDSDKVGIVKNGYLFVYVSNETPNYNVYFDNLQVTHKRGPLLEETHYYPYGLTMTGVSSKAFGGIDNKRKYNGIELNNDLNLNTYEAFYRNLDPQIGRWWQIDPKIESMEQWSPYASNYDNPLKFSDPLGDEPGDGEDPPKGKNQIAVGVKESLSNNVKGLFNLRSYTAIFTVWFEKGDLMTNLENAGLIYTDEQVAKALNGDRKTISGMITDGVFLVAVAKATPKAVGFVTRNFVRNPYPGLQRSGISLSALKERLSALQARAAKLSEKQRPGQNHTRAGKEVRKEINKAQNGGTLTCEGCGRTTVPSKKSVAGETTPKNATQIDHIDAKSKGGSGTPDNSQVLCAECNVAKSNN
jgi:RHS repeat-associated protein